MVEQARENKAEAAARNSAAAKTEAEGASVGSKSETVAVGNSMDYYNEEDEQDEQDAQDEQIEQDEEDEEDKEDELESCVCSQSFLLVRY